MDLGFGNCARDGLNWAKRIMNNPARWATDPTGRFPLRYWDGQSWTQYVSKGDGGTLVDTAPIVAQSQQTIPRVTSSTSSAPSRGGASAGGSPQQRQRPTLTLKKSPQQQATAITHLHVDARSLVVPPVGQVGEIHQMSGLLRKRNVIVLRHDLRSDQLIVVAEDGERKVVQGAFASAAETTVPMQTRIGRLWWNLRNRPAGFSREALAGVQEVYDSLMAPGTDETVAFGLEAIAHGLERSEAIACGVEPWRVSYETLRLGGRSDRGEDAVVRELLRDPQCPVSVRLSVALNSGALGADTLRPWPALAAAISEGKQGNETLPRQLLSEARDYASTLARIGGSGAEQIRSVLDHPERCAGPLQGLLKALGDSQPAGVVPVPSATPISVVDDLIDQGMTVELEQDWPEIEKRYVVARQDPSLLSDEEVISLDLEKEGRKRALAGNLETFGHLLGDEERFTAAIGSAITPGRAVDLGVLQQMEDDPMALALVTAVQTENWSDLPSGLLEVPGVASLLLSLPVPDRDPLSEIESRIMGRAKLRAARESLFEWKWDEAIRIGQQALKFAAEEQVRDELMNVVAAALWSKGSEPEALRLLRKALEGHYTLPLVCNTAAVAASLDTGTALTELLKLARESTDDTMRLIAAERAFVVWHNSIEDEDQAPPLMLVTALRSLLTLNATEDHYRDILRILAEHDGEWLQQQPPATFGGRRGSPEVRVYQAKARGLSKYIVELSAVHNVQPRPKWVEEEAVRLGMSLVGFLASSFGEESASTAVMIAVDVLASSLPLPASVHVRMVAFLSASVSKVATEGEPKDEFVTWFHRAQTRLNEIDAEERGELTEVLNQGGNSLGLSYLEYRNQLVDQMIDLFNSHVEQANKLLQYGQLNQAEFAKAMNELAAMVHECVGVIKRAQSVISDADIQQGAAGLLASAQALETSCREAAR